MSRDLLAALWPASYKGVPFWVEKDTEQGGRRLAVHQFYGRDEPYIQDLGAEARRFEVTFYLASESYDLDALALVSTLASAGPGTLVLPINGAVQAHLGPFSRMRDKDRIGYVAFTGTFHRAGASSPLASIGSLAQLAFDAVAALTDAAGPVLAALATRTQPAWVVASAVGAAQDIVAALDDLRAASVPDPAATARLATAFATVYQALPGWMAPEAAPDSSIAPSLAGLAVALADAMAPADAVAGLGALFDGLADPAPVDPARSANAATATANARVLADTARIAYLAGYVEALMRATYASRQDAIGARALCVERFDQAFDGGTGADQADLYVALQAMRNSVVDYLSAQIATLAPVVTVTTGVMMSSLVMAYRLYADPARAADLIARNGVPHPSFLPLQFEALAPAATTLLPVAA